MGKCTPVKIGVLLREGKKKTRVPIHPGPIYDPHTPFGATGTHVGFPRGPRELQLSKNPGPGDYSPEAVPAEQSQLGTRCRELIPMPPPKRNKMPYYGLAGTIQPAKKSMLKRPPTIYATMSPGPKYKVPSSIAPKNKTIGIRSVVKTGVDNPSPDSYWLAPDPPPPPPINGIIGPMPDERCVVNLKYQAKMPGPGYYDAVDYFAPGPRKGFTMKHRPVTVVRPDNAAPYHACKSTLGGPKWTIGLKGV
jgi:hypothetical protein